MAPDFKVLLAERRETAASRAIGGLAVGSCLLAAIAALYAAVVWGGRATAKRSVTTPVSSPGGVDRSGGLLRCSPDRVVFGVVEQGGRRQRRFSLINHGTVLVTIAKIETSCSCVEVRLPHFTLLPGETVEAVAQLDLASDTQFTGNLGVEIEGFTQDGLPAFAAVAEIKVRVRPETDSVDLHPPER